jgi:SNF2 family DNA or RNA helicase
MDMNAALAELSNKASWRDVESPQVRVFARGIAKAVPWPDDVTPYEFQEVSIAYAAAARFRCLIGDAMGLGKTITAIGCLNLGTKLSRPLTPALVVSPASVTGEWAKALEKFGIDFEVVNILNGKTKPQKPRKNTVYVTSWGLLKSTQDHLRHMRLRTLILDESHTAKEPKAQCTRAAMRLSQRVPYVLELSGTPAPNRTKELWTQLWMLDSKTFEDRAHFAEQVDEVLPYYMVRRLKSQVLKELPPKTRHYLQLTMDPEAADTYARVEEEVQSLIARSLLLRMLKEAESLYKRAIKRGAEPLQAAQWAVRTTNASPPTPEQIAQVTMVRLGHLRRTIGQLKVPLALKFTHQHFENTKRPLVIFVEHKKVLRALGKGLRAQGLKWSYIDGSTPKKTRTKRVEAFQAGRTQVLLCSQAAYAGITLTKASEMLFVERWWVPSREEQAEDRLHRIGQKRKVCITYLMASDTMDDYVANLVDLKRETLEALLGGETVNEQLQVAHASIPQNLSRQVASQILKRLDFSPGEVSISVRHLKTYLKRKRLKRRRR